MKGFIGVHSDNWNFVNMESGDIFIPFGANYFDPETGWAPKIWQKFDKNRVQEHFHMMADAGVNIARVFLSCTSFQPEPDSILKDGLEKLDTMIEIAKQTEIRLMFTGPDAWEGAPGYWKPDRYAGEPALKALEYFWHEIGSRYKDETAIFAWDLLNEPMILWESKVMLQKWHNWLLDKYKDTASLAKAWDDLGDGESLETAAIPQNDVNAGNQRLYDYQLFRESIAWEWTKRQVDAIREVDPNHMVTVGLIQWSFPLVRASWGGNAGKPGGYAAFNPKKLAPLLDFTCIHFYPVLGDPGNPESADLNTRYLQAAADYCYAGKPVVLGEYGWHGGGEMKGKYHPESYQSAWNNRAVRATTGLISGWLVWAFSDTPSSTDLTIYGGIYNIKGELKEWGKDFKALAQRFKSEPKLMRWDKSASVDMDERQALTADVRPLFEQYVAD